MSTLHSPLHSPPLRRLFLPCLSPVTLSLWLVVVLACLPISGCSDDAAPAVDASPDNPDATAPDAQPATPDAGADAGTPDAGLDAGPPERRVSLMLHGGGSEDDDIFQRFVEAAGHGHIVTIGAVQDPGNYPYLLFWDGYFTGLGASSAETINTETAGEVTPELAQVLASADGIFIRGGNQARYIEYWKDSPIQDQLIAAWQRGAVIAGSSAGTAILGRPLYDARVGGVAAYEALLDPFDSYITFTDELIPALDNVITDTHFTERGRPGRLAVFLLRAPFDPVGDIPLGLGIDPRTAVLVYNDGSMEVIGRGSATLMDARPGPTSVTTGTPPEIDEMRFWQMPAGYHFDIGRLRAGVDPVTQRPAYVVPGPAMAPDLGPWPIQLLDGDDLVLRDLGDWQLVGLDGDPDAWRTGGLSLAPGLGTLPGALVVTGLYEDSDFFENHLGGMLWAVAQHPQTVAIGVDVYLRARTSEPCGLTAFPGDYALVIDARRALHVGVPPAGGWQTAALENASLRVIGNGNSWDCSP